MPDRLRIVIQPPIGEAAPAMICVLTKRTIDYGGKCFSAQDHSAAIENSLLVIVDLGYQSGPSAGVPCLMPLSRTVKHAR